MGEADIEFSDEVVLLTGEAAEKAKAGGEPSEPGKVLARFANDPTLAFSVNFNVNPGDGLSQEKVDETRASLRDLGLNESLDLERKETGTDG